MCEHNTNFPLAFFALLIANVQIEMCIRDRDYSISDQSVSLNTLSGRLHISFESKGIEHWLRAGGRFGTARLIRKNRKYYLHIPVTL